LPRDITRPDWRGIRLVSQDLGSKLNHKLAHLQFDGIQYATLTELLVAQMLTLQKVRFTPNVLIHLGLVPVPGHKFPDQPVIYVPDFILNKDEFLWTWPDGVIEVIHGIECKGLTRQASHKDGNLHKVHLLDRERHIHLVAISEEETLEFQAAGGLPLVKL
jgi:hypothetical protein